jgi:hypothetical protein
MRSTHFNRDWTFLESPERVYLCCECPSSVTEGFQLDSLSGISFQNGQLWPRQRYPSPKQAAYSRRADGDNGQGVRLLRAFKRIRSNRIRRCALPESKCTRHSYTENSRQSRSSKPIPTSRTGKVCCFILGLN